MKSKLEMILGYLPDLDTDEIDYLADAVRAFQKKTMSQSATVRLMRSEIRKLRCAGKNQKKDHGVSPDIRAAIREGVKEARNVR